MKHLWMAVEANEFELPIYVEESREELARKLKIQKKTVSTIVNRMEKGKYNGKKSGFLIYKIPLIA